MDTRGTKLKILIAAGELISTLGYHNVSVREICEAAGVTKPVLYYYFKDKEDVLAQLLIEGHSRFRELFYKYIHPGLSFEKKLNGLYRIYVIYARTFPYLIKISAHVQFSPLPKKIKTLNNHKGKEIQELIKSIFIEGIKKKYFRKDVGSEMLAYSLIAPFGAFIAESILLKNDIRPLKENLKKYFDFWKSQFLKRAN